MWNPFNEDISIIYPSNSSTGTSLPTNQDLYFVAKWRELFFRYSSARSFLSNTQNDNWSYWFSPVSNPTTQKAFELIFKANLYETALIHYNIVVDLSWTLTYVSAEFALYDFDSDDSIKNINKIQDVLPLEESYDLLRKAEKVVVSPLSEVNPFSYLKKMTPEFSEAVDLITEFWKDFSNSEIRDLYNYIKHKGKPLYEEIEHLHQTKTTQFFIGKKEYASNVIDVQKIINLEKGIKNLISFDNDKLFHYIKNLLESLKIAVDPSPWAY
ncbi:MAG: hypothetical protein Q8873_02595 [Bacillota bacterium]|nr:hypothetical protein [Bacillota bacterium]